VVVVGGGISGLAAAWQLASGAAGVGPEILLLEARAELGGLLRPGEVGGVRLDVGAESVLARRPEAVQLIHQAGLGADLVHPVTSAASVLARGRLVPMPAGTLMGVPGNPSTLRGLLDDAELADVLTEPDRPAEPLGHDVDVASWVTARMGRAVLDRLVEPLLGGVYAGHADRLSLRAGVPALWEIAARGGSVLHQVAALPAAAGPVFAGVRGGVARLPEALAAGLTDRGVRIRTGVSVRGLHRTPAGWSLETGPAGRGELIEADAVVLAVPPAPAARLLRGAAPAASAELAGIRTASVAVVAVLLPAGQLSGVPGSGLLVPPVEGRAIKAVTLSSAKWGWVTPDGGPVVLRISLGRAGEEAVLQQNDADLAALAVSDLAAVLRRPLTPLATRVVRWGGALPQYDVGHADRVVRIRTALDSAPGLALCGAALDGVGVAACIATARAAARRAQAGLGAAGTRETMAP
jgi:oxygen-dependent protoporphyrinogen oxidase